MLRRNVLRVLVALGFVISSAAVAQDATTPPPAAPPPAAPPPAAAPQSAVVGEAPAAAPAAKGDEERTEEIVVTGTRIRRKDLTTPAPVSVVNRDALQNSGKISLGDFLQSVPEQGNSVNTQVNNGNDGSVQVSLRNLFPQRTLVLVNGRRMVSGGSPGQPTIGVDLNTIPAAAVERVEILKDGASAVYGSDAIAGVVNVILKRKYTGSEASVYGGVTGHSDGQTAEVSAITGTSSDRGNILFSVGLQQQEKVLAGDRSWSETTIGYDWDGSVTGTVGGKYDTGNSSTFPNGRFTVPGLTRTADGKTITGCSLTGTAAYTQLCADAVAANTSSFVPTPGAGAGGAVGYVPYDGSLYNTNPTNYLITPNRRIQLFSSGDANLGDVARAFFQASYVDRTSQQNLAPIPVVNNTIPNKPVSISAQSIYNPFGVDVTTWRRRFMEFGNRFFTQNLDTVYIVTGLDGSLGDWASVARGWNWEAYYSYGRTQGTQVDAGQVRMPQLGDATGPSAINPATNQPVCLRNKTGTSADFTKANIIAGCVPANMLGGTGTLDPAAKTYLGFDGPSKAWNEEQIWALNLSGDLVAIPTSERPMGLALGVEHRLEYAGFTPDPVTAHLESSGNNQLATAGSYDVTEGYAELSIPLVQNKPGVQDLELSAAIRAFDYSSFGSDSTYKFGGRYSPIRDVTLRGTYSTAYRAPAVVELYGGAADSFDLGGADPCKTAAGAAAHPECQSTQQWGHVPGSGSGDSSTQFLSKRSPNANLKPETATIYTAGIVLEPRAIPTLSATVDYYNIYLKHTINVRTSPYIINQCYLSGDQNMCARILRDANGIIQVVTDTRDNLGSTKTSGIDLALRYGIPTPTAGRFNLVFDGTYLLQYDTTDVSGVTDKQAGNYDQLVALPKVKFNVSVLWAKGGLGAGITGRYVGSFKECADQDTNPGLCGISDANSHAFDRTISQYMPFDVFLSYALKSRAGTTSFAVGVQNVFDETPPYSANAGAANSDPGTYDYLGRFFYLRLTQTI